MRADELQKIYSRTAGTFKQQPKEYEAEAWKKTLSGYSVADLEAALARHADNMEFDEFRGVPKCTIMPSPADLRYSVMKFEKDRENLKTGRFVSCERNGCSEGWIHVPAGKWISNDGQPGRNEAVRACECRIDYISRKKGAQ